MRGDAKKNEKETRISTHVLITSSSWDCRQGLPGVEQKQKPLTEWRAFDSPLVEIPCKMPGDDKEKDHWNDDCITQIRKSKNTLPEKVKQAAKLKAKACKPPDIVNSLPDRLRRKVLKIWEERDPKGDCWQQQRRTRLILLNLPPSLRKSVRPQALQCSLPHFIDRLEWDLQVKLRRLWTNYKEGEPCSR
ncbi:hypothetical protein GCK32_013932, partial [Trichostrongylus colubriformis]